MLVNTAFGEELLHAIGWVYANKAEQWMGFHDGSILCLDGRAARLGQRSDPVPPLTPINSFFLVKRKIAARMLQGTMCSSSQD